MFTLEKSKESQIYNLTSYLKNFKTTTSQYKPKASRKKVTVTLMKEIKDLNNIH